MLDPFINLEVASKKFLATYRTLPGVEESGMDGLARFNALIELWKKDQKLFYYIVSQNVSEMMPIIYTPKVGDAIKMATQLPPAEALHISYDDFLNESGEVDREKIKKAITQYCAEHGITPKVFLATDAEAILGIGDHGANGAAIVVGKAMLDVLGGVNPNVILQIMLDVGTNTESILEDTKYRGLRRKRINDAEYESFTDALVDIVAEDYPGTTLHWEDLSYLRARPILDKKRKHPVCQFNDDMQGTAAVVFAALQRALNIRNEKLLTESTYVIYGAGTAGCAIADRIVSEMQQQGLSEEEARARIFLLDSKGLVRDDSRFNPYKAPYAKSSKEWGGESSSLLEVVTKVKPDCLIGTSGKPDTFTKAVIDAMGQKQPIVFPLSNPTKKAEQSPVKLMAWTDNRALIATGSPFLYADGRTPVPQGNNAFVFPGLTLGAIVAQATEMTENMFRAAIYELVKFESNAVLPSSDQLSEVSLRIAKAVAWQAMKDGVALNQCTEEEIYAQVDKERWSPAAEEVSGGKRYDPGFFGRMGEMLPTQATATQTPGLGISE